LDIVPGSAQVKGYFLWGVSAGGQSLLLGERKEEGIDSKKKKKEEGEGKVRIKRRTLKGTGGRTYTSKGALF